MNDVRIGVRTEMRLPKRPPVAAVLDADILRRKMIFGEHLLQHVPLASHIRHTLDERSRGRVSRRRFLHELQASLHAEEAERVLAVVTDWGRYAEIFDYDDAQAQFNLENPEATARPAQRRNEPPD